MRSVGAVFMLLLIQVLLCSCATAPPLNTASGRPDVTIAGTNGKEVTDWLANEMLTNGCQIRSVTDYSLVAGKKSESLLANVLLGSRYDPSVEERITFNIVSVPGGVRVVATSALVTNPGSPYEKYTDTTAGKAAEQVQQLLERLRASLAK